MNTAEHSLSTVVRARGLKKNYKEKEVLSGLNLDLPGNHLHGLLGRNGTGKSTLLSMIAGQIRSSGGELRVFGEDPFDNASVMDRIVYAGIDVPFPGSWEVRTILEAAAVRHANWHHPTALTLAEDFSLDPGEKYENLSRGQRSMVGIIIGLAARAPLTLLDEPYLGLDVHNRTLFYSALLAEMTEFPRTVVLATHDIEESAKLLDTFLVLGRDGRVHHHHGAEELTETYVTVSGAQLPLIDSALARAEVTGRARMIIPRCALEELDLSALQVEPSDLDEVLTALLEKD